MASDELKEDYKGEGVQDRSSPLVETPSVGSLTAEDKQWGMFCHLSVLAGFLVGGLFFIGPLICWLIKKDTSKFADYHGKEALNFGISIFVYMIVSAMLSAVLIGIPLLIAVMIFGVVMPIIAGMKANEGEHYKYSYIFRVL
jgi:uncharacterized Tic20 family protein